MLCVIPEFLLYSDTGIVYIYGINKSKQANQQKSPHEERQGTKKQLLHNDPETSITNEHPSTRPLTPTDTIESVDVSTPTDSLFETLVISTFP